MTILDRLSQGITTATAEETRAIGSELAAVLTADSTLALHGDMGVGKTTFVQGLAHGLGVREQVTSPTFAIYTVYRGAGRTLVHLDAYRLENELQVESLLLEEFLVSPWILAVEWPGKTGGWLSPLALHLTLSIVKGHRHKIVLQ